MSRKSIHEVGSLPLGMLVLLCAVAAALRLYHLGYRSYWLDEAVSLELARDPWPVFTRVIRSTEANMVLYFTLLRPWVALGGASETWVRLLSCVIGVLTLPVLYAVGTRLFDRVTGLVASGVLALDTPHVWASQEARSYSLLVLLTTTSWWLLLRAAGQQRGVRAVASWALYILVATLAVYAHFYAVLVLAAQGITLLFVPLPRSQAPSSDAPVCRRVSPVIAVACGVAFLVLLSPIAVFLQRPHHNIDWISNGARGLDATLAILSRMISHPTSTQGRNELYVLVFAGPLAVIGSWRRQVVRDARWRWALLLLWLCIPIGVSIAVSWALEPSIDARYLSICLPPLALLVAGALTQLWPRWAARLMLLLVVGASIPSLNWYYHRLQNEDWRGASSYVLTRAQTGDYVLFFASYVRSPFNLYRRADQAQTASPPAADAPPIETPRWRPLAETTAAARAHAIRVWVILSHNAKPDCERLVDRYLRQRFTTSDSTDFNLIRVRLYQNPINGAADTTQAGDINTTCY